MRTLAILLTLSLGEIWACSCVGPGDPSQAAGHSAAVFTGTVLNITEAPAHPQRTVRLRVGQVLSGLSPGQTEVDVVTGQGGGDCGFPFATGQEFFVYAYRTPDGKLGTGICSRTRPIADAAEDLAYLRANAGTPATSRLTVKTAYAGLAPKAGVLIAVEAAGRRLTQVTNAAGDAIFENLPPGTYRVHSVDDGDLPDDPKIELGARGSRDVTLIRFLTIRGRVSALQGPPPAGVRVQLRSTGDEPWEESVTGTDGRYEIKLMRPGRYYLGINLNQPSTAESPYRRWFHPGVPDPAAATVIEFTGKPGVVNYNLTLPAPEPLR